MIVLLAACAAVSDVEPERAPLPACPSFAAGIAAGEIVDPALSEVSGMVASRSRAETWWMHNDSGDQPQVFAVSADTVEVSTLAVGFPLDWEDIALVQGDAGDDLVVGDIGDNIGLRVFIEVHRFAEPVTAGEVDDVTTFRLTYPDGAHDAESLFVDPDNGDLYVVTKSLTGDAKAYRMPAPWEDGGVLEEVATLTGGLRGSGVTTGADLLDRDILVRTYGAAFLWRRPLGWTVAEALLEPSCPLTLEAEPQGEAIAWDPNGGFRTVSEGVGSTIWSYDASPVR